MKQIKVQKVEMLGLGLGLQLGVGLVFGVVHLDLWGIRHSAEVRPSDTVDFMHIDLS